MTPHVLVLDDDPLTRVSVAAALGAREGVTVVCEASTASQGVNFVKDNRVDVAFLDIYLGPGPTGIDVAWALRQIHPAIGIVFLTSLTDPRILGEGYRGVPKGSVYLVKSEVTSVADIVATINQARNFLSAPNGAKSALPPTPFTPGRWRSCAWSARDSPTRKSLRSWW